MYHCAHYRNSRYDVRGHIQAFVSLFLKIGLHRKAELVDENLLEGREVVLLIEQEHRLLVVDAPDRAERDGAIAVGYQYGIARDAGNALVAVVECLNVG